MATLAPARKAEAVSDDALLARIGRGRDPGAFAQFYERHGTSAFNLARYLVRDRAVAEEVVQEAMLVVWRKAGQYQPFNARNWLLRIVAQISHRTFDRNLRKRSIMTGNDDLLRAARAPELDDAGESGEARAALRRNLDDLSDGDRRLVALYYGSGLSQSEIAEELEMPQRTVSDRLKRVLALLRTRMAASGFAAAAPLLNMESINAALTGGEAAPEGLHAAALNEALRSAARASAREFSRRAAPPLFGALVPLAACALAAAGLVAYLLLQPEERSDAAPAPQHEAAIEQSSMAPAATSQASAGTNELAGPAASAAPAKPEDPEAVHKVWDFTQGPAKDLFAAQGEWFWQPKKGRLDAGMVASDEGFTKVALPTQFPRRPLRITLEYQWMEWTKPARGGAIWRMADRGVPRNTPYARRIGHTQMPEHSVVEVYLFDRWAVEVIEGAVGSVREFEEDYPSSHIVVYFVNRVTQKIRADTIAMDEIPAEIRDPRKVIERDGLTVQGADAASPKAP